MDSTFQALGGLLLKGIPTIVFLVLLHWYLKLFFFKRLQEKLNERRQATEGAREAAERSFKQAEDRAAHYEAELRRARADLRSEQEKIHRSWVEEQTKSMDQARHEAHELVQNARHQIDEQTAAARETLQRDAQGLADRIAASLLEGAGEREPVESEVA